MRGVGTLFRPGEVLHIVTPLRLARYGQAWGAMSGCHPRAAQSLKRLDRGRWLGHHPGGANQVVPGQPWR
jgi:hypothetical protein